MRAPLRSYFKDLPTSDMKEILLQCMLEENYDKGHEDHWMAYKSLQKSILRDESEQFDADKAKERKKMKRASGTTGASDSAQDPLPPPQSPTTNPDDQFEHYCPSIPEEVFMHEESDFEAQDMVSDDEDIGNERPATPEPAWSIPSSSLPVPIHNWASALASSYMEECHKLLTNQVDNRLLSKGDRLALSITKMKAMYYPVVGLEQMLLDQMWIKEECMYDISATYGISHWSPEPPTAKGQEYSLYCCQLMDQESGYQTTGRRLPTRHRELPNSTKPPPKPRRSTGPSSCTTTRFLTLQEPYCSETSMVKEFKVNKNNQVLNTRFWTTNDVIKCKQFMFAIQKRLKLKRIFRNLESFVGGRIRKGDYRLLRRTE
ncbi:hypothetical protein Tco_0704341 [Tanacetum coccineum]|uniref:Uncharacterized protein n=1 Tax=Tanacetum coccineum TaxID=301880 RepID=A0ABQ4Y383_9ASTR